MDTLPSRYVEISECNASLKPRTYDDHESPVTVTDILTEERPSLAINFERQDLEGFGGGVWENTEDMLQLRGKSIRRFLGFSEFMFVGSIITLGLYVLYNVAALRDKWFSLFLYITVSLALDGMMLILAGVSLCLFWVLCGEAAVKHATTVVSIMLRLFQTLTVSGLAVSGLYFLIKDYEKLLNDYPIYLFIYLFLETSLMVAYSFETFFVIYGLLKYIKDCIYTPLLYAPLSREYDGRLSEYPSVNSPPLEFSRMKFDKPIDQRQNEPISNDSFSHCNAT